MKFLTSRDQDFHCILLALLTAVVSGHTHGQYHGSNLNLRYNASIEERWFTINNGLNQGTTTWPNAQVTYCYKDDAASALHNHIIDGWTIWLDAGLDGDHFKWVQGTPAQCADRANILLISANDDGLLATSVGKSAASQSPPVSDGPSMSLSTKTSVGMLNIAANFAHEIGHAWGLFHEQQRPELWGPDYGNDLGDQLFNFQCQNLADYSKMVAKLPNAADQVKACHEQRFAAQAEFSAAEFLPLFNRGSAPGLLGPFGSADDVDWASIMLYSTPVGGSGTATDVNNDQRAAVLERTDGVNSNRIPFNTVPSGSDLDALRRLYPYNEVNDAPCLLNQDCNPKKSKWQSLKKKCGIKPNS